MRSELWKPPRPRWPPCVSEDLCAELVGRFACSVDARRRNHEVAELGAQAKPASGNSRTPRSSLPCPAWAPSPTPSSSPRPTATSARFRRPRPPRRSGSSSPGTPGKSAATCAGPAATAAACNSPSSSPLKPTCSSVPSRRRTATGRGGRQGTQASRPHPRPAPCQCPLGHDPLSHAVSDRPNPRSSRLTVGTGELPLADLGVHRTS